MPTCAAETGESPLITVQKPPASWCHLSARLLTSSAILTSAIELTFAVEFCRCTIPLNPVGRVSREPWGLASRSRLLARLSRGCQLPIVKWVASALTFRGGPPGRSSVVVVTESVRPFGVRFWIGLCGIRGRHGDLGISNDWCSC